MRVRNLFIQTLGYTYMTVGRVPGSICWRSKYLCPQRFQHYKQGNIIYNIIYIQYNVLYNNEYLVIFYSIYNKLAVLLPSTFSCDIFSGKVMIIRYPLIAAANARPIPIKKSIDNRISRYNIK